MRSSTYTWAAQSSVNPLLVWRTRQSRNSREKNLVHVDQTAVLLTILTELDGQRPKWFVPMIRKQIVRGVNGTVLLRTANLLRKCGTIWYEENQLSGRSLGRILKAALPRKRALHPPLTMRPYAAIPISLVAWRGQQHHALTIMMTMRICATPWFAQSLDTIVLSLYES